MPRRWAERASVHVGGGRNQGHRIEEEVGRSRDPILDRKVDSATPQPPSITDPARRDVQNRWQAVVGDMPWRAGPMNHPGCLPKEEPEDE